MKLCLISDTHLTVPYGMRLPDADVLVHAGDFCNRGTLEDAVAYMLWLKKYKKQFKKIIQIAGNHDFIAQKDSSWLRSEFKKHFGKKLVYLDHEEYVYEGVKFFGSPYQPWFHDWAFNVPRNELHKYWEAIPDDTDVLVTHGPPYKIMDRTYYDNLDVGCEALLKRIQELPNLKLNVFGHIHEFGGQQCEIDGVTYVNASINTLQYFPSNKPVIIDI